MFWGWRIYCYLEWQSFCGNQIAEGSLVQGVWPQWRSNRQLSYSCYLSKSSISYEDGSWLCAVADATRGWLGKVKNNKVVLHSICRSWCLGQLHSQKSSKYWDNIGETQREGEKNQSFFISASTYFYSSLYSCSYYRAKDAVYREGWGLSHSRTNDQPSNIKNLLLSPQYW
jgi:hypothetical protein